MTKATSTVLLAGCTLLAAFGCGNSASSSSSDRGPASTATTRARLASGGTYYATTRDARLCPSPWCGGYWLRALNDVADPSVYVSALDFGDTGIGPDDEQAARSARDGEILVRGAILDAVDPASGLPPTFSASEVYLGLPGQDPYGGLPLDGKTQDLVRYSKATNLPLGCAACPTIQLSNLNLDDAQMVFSIDDPTPPGLQGSWIDDKTLNDALPLDERTIVTGLVQDVDTYPVLSAFQIFFRLPEAPGPCPDVSEPVCDDGLLATHATRSPDRCWVPTGDCVVPPPCALFVLDCNAGYTLVQQVGPSGCPEQFCDPSFSHPQAP
jgi:hypothetical protein